MTDLLTATAAARAIREGRLSSEDLVQQFLDAIAAREPAVQAFEHLDPEAALAQAWARDLETPRAPLHGVPIAVKDIIDTDDMPTSYGSAIYRGNCPPWDAACVALCRTAGMVILGKTVTTEFAYFTPGKTRNPHDPKHTPGGSSSGSAAAVAAGMAPLAFGSQTAGSVIRPAAFCGVVGYKPSHGDFSLEGVLGLCPSLDTLGAFARSVADLRALRAVLLAGEETTPAPPTAPRLGLCLPCRDRAEPAALEIAEASAEKLRAAGATVTVLALDDLFESLVQAQLTVMTWETARSRASEYLHRRRDLSERFRQLVEDGLAVSLADYRRARDAARAGRERLGEVFASLDAILTLPAPGEAPVGLDATGDPLFNRVWTLLGAPCLNLPVGRGPQGLPLGVQLVGPVGADPALLSLGEWVVERLSSD